MDISDYRGRFASFNSSLELARFQNYVGLRAEPSVHEVYDLFSDLFSREAIAELKSFREHIPANQETQIKGVDKLISSACIHFAESRASDVSNELQRCEKASSIEWRGQTIPPAEIPERLSKDPNKDSRRELSARWLDSVLECNDLRVARRASLNDAARLVGFDSFSGIAQDSGIASGGKLELAINSLLKETDSQYNAVLNNLLAREVQDLSRDELSFADLPYIKAMPWLDQYYSTTQYVRIQDEMMTGLGIRRDQQREIRIDSEPRVGRKRRAKCFPIAPPFDVRVAMLPLVGAAAFLDSMEYFGKTQFLVWCSQDLARRNPEFVYTTDSADAATSLSYSYLFRYLPIDIRWHLDFLGGTSESKAAPILRDLSFDLALQARLACAEAACENEDSPGAVTEESSSNYEAFFRGATSCNARKELYLFVRQEGEDPRTKLRALAFSFTLREYLRTRFGHRWWMSKKAGDELVDLWSTASRYSVEELASLIGFGDLSFDLLGHAINSALTGDRLGA
jgi:hypothetical protein